MSPKDIDQAEVSRFSEGILEVLTSARGGAVARPVLMTRIEGATQSKRAFKVALKQLVAEGRLLELGNKHYALPGGRMEVVGILRSLPGGRAVVLPDTALPEPFADAREVRISERERDTALHGDRVRVRLNRERYDGKPTGSVVAILERRQPTLVGQYYAMPRGGRVVPRDARFDRSLLLPTPLPPDKVANGDFIVARITRYTRAPEPLLGEFVEHLGRLGDAGLDITVLLRSLGCTEVFADDVLAEAEALPAHLPEAEAAHRRDLRHAPICTIDGADAKDFDDAITVHRLPNHCWRLGVHIADVSWYVRSGTRLDEEARDRATSIYPLDRVVPMLPERLSNDLCSLRPREDRAALSCEMTINAEGVVLDYEIYESVIHSKHRLTYDEVQEFFDADDHGRPGPPAFTDIQPMLREARALARCLTRMRLKRGALDLDLPETKVLVGADGRTHDVVRRPRFESHQLIEELMLITNETVAEHMKRKGLPTLYRVHGTPDMERVGRLVPVLKGLGIPASSGIDWGAAQFQAVLGATERLGTAGPAIRRLLLRTLMKAVYSHENIGHFGLASTTYLHFTSPIRRYPDLLTHRALRATLRLKGQELANALAVYADELPAMGRHTSAMERQAMEIEMQAASIKSMELMERHLGEEFEGVVVGVSLAGAFIELTQWPIEGLIPVRTLEGYFEFNEENLTLRCDRNGLIFRVGDVLHARVERVDVSAGQMELKYLSHAEGGRRPANTAQRGLLAAGRRPSTRVAPGRRHHGHGRPTWAPPVRRGRRRR